MSAFTCFSPRATRDCVWCSLLCAAMTSSCRCSSCPCSLVTLELSRPSSDRACSAWEGGGAAGRVSGPGPHQTGPVQPGGGGKQRGSVSITLSAQGLFSQGRAAGEVSTALTEHSPQASVRKECDHPTSYTLLLRPHSHVQALTHTHTCRRLTFSLASSIRASVATASCLVMLS